MHPPSPVAAIAFRPSRSQDQDALPALAWLEAFASLVQETLAEEDDEQLRTRYENELLRRAAWLRATGLFDVMQVKDPALRAMLDDLAR